eukprot:EG_transcript_33882
MDGVTCGHCGFPGVPPRAAFCPDCGSARAREGGGKPWDGPTPALRLAPDAVDGTPPKRMRPAPPPIATCPDCRQGNIAFDLMEEHQRRHCVARKAAALRMFQQGAAGSGDGEAGGAPGIPPRFDQHLRAGGVPSDPHPHTGEVRHANRDQGPAQLGSSPSHSLPDPAP